MKTTQQELREKLVRALVEQGFDVELARAKADHVSFTIEPDGKVSSLGLWVGGPVPTDQTDPVQWLAGQIVEQREAREASQVTKEPKKAPGLREKIQAAVDEKYGRNDVWERRRQEMFK